MKKEQILKELIKILNKWCNRSDITRVSLLKEDLEMDSLDMAELSMEIEIIFKMELGRENDEILYKLKTVDEVADFIKRLK